jgi:hypothetical protein
VSTMPPRFGELIGLVTGAVANRPVEPALGAFLNERFPFDGVVVSELTELCLTGRQEGWLCAREQGGVRFGRPIKPGPASHGFSVDVVDMDAVVGPHHRHPKGEIDLVMPRDAKATFDGVRHGWLVYGPASSHAPTVAGGRALVLYLLPDGTIEFTGV